jgi:hypothetical protein
MQFTKDKWHHRRTAHAETNVDRAIAFNSVNANFAWQVGCAGPISFPNTPGQTFAEARRPESPENSEIAESDHAAAGHPPRKVQLPERRNRRDPEDRALREIDAVIFRSGFRQGQTRDLHSLASGHQEQLRLSPLHDPLRKLAYHTEGAYDILCGRPVDHHRANVLAVS